MEVSIARNEIAHRHSEMKTSKLVTAGFEKAEGEELINKFHNVLNHFYDPDFKGELGEFSIVEFGLIRGIHCDRAKGVVIEMILTTPTCSSAPFIVETVRQLSQYVVKDIEGMARDEEGKPKVEVKLLADRWHGDLATGELRDFLEDLCAHSPLRFKEIFGRSGLDA